MSATVTAGCTGLRRRSMLEGALRVYLVIGPDDTAGRPVPQVVDAALDGGATMIQIRGKGLAASALMQLIRAVEPLLAARAPRPPLIVDDRVDVVLMARTAGLRVDGVHLGQGDAAPERARALLGTDAVIGLSTCPVDLQPDEPLLPGHSTRAEGRRREVIAASMAGACAADAGLVDYLGVGPLHVTSSKPDAPRLGLGIDGFRKVREQSPLPAVAIGGVTAADATGLRAAGGAGLSVISAVAGAEDPRRAAHLLRSSWDDARPSAGRPSAPGRPEGRP